MGQRLGYWILLGSVGIAVFIVLRPAVDFNASAPIQQSRATIERSTRQLAGELGFSLDSLHLLTTRSQHLQYFKSIKKDRPGVKPPNPGALNRKNVFLNSWQATIGSLLRDQDATSSFSPEDLFSKTGRLQLRYDGKGRVRRLATNPDNPNPTFVAGDSLLSIAREITGGIFDYNLAYYELTGIDVSDTLVTPSDAGFSQESLDFSETSLGNNTTFYWNKIDPSIGSPERIELEVQPKIREQREQYGARIRYGASVVSFAAMAPDEPESLTGASEINNFRYVVFFVSLALLVGFVFFKGIKHINKGQVEWKRVLFIFVTVTLAIFGWRVLLLVNTYAPFISGGSLIILTFNFLLFGVVTGMYGALAYIGWEATAREEDEDQLHLIDAFWRYRFFFRETGDGLLRGYALGGVLLGLFALSLYLFGFVFYQHDSQFGYMEPSINPKLLSINMNGWVNAWLVSLGHIGITVGIFRNNISSSTLFYSVTSAVMGFLLVGSAILVGTTGSIWFEMALFIAISPILIYAFNRAGLLSVSIGWWIFASTILLLPYFGSGSLDTSYIAWVEIFIVSFPFLYGVAAYRYGNSVSEMGGYIPEYQERIANHLRVEKEIEIARESQYRLMPLRPPVVPDIDVYGFFLPSFEVGGDYFDYVVSRNGRQETQTLTMTIVDVSGKAMKAAMHAVFTSGLLLSRLYKDHPASILREVAPTLYHRTDPQTFITCIIAQYRMHDKKLVVANAGHCLPILKRRGKAQFLNTPHPKYPLGLRDRINYESMEETLLAGDFLLFYSDGLPEAADPEGNRFGYDSLLEFVESLDTERKSSNEIAMEIKHRIQKFSDHQLADDTTIICLKI